LRIIQKKVSRILFNKRVVTLDLASVAGTKYRGQFEERMKAVMNELRKNDDIILLLMKFTLLWCVELLVLWMHPICLNPL
jgi:ATP-dependent Clp protease ATP-binding subunit ClpA